MTWRFSDNAKLIRRHVYSEFLERGSCGGITEIGIKTGLAPTALYEAIEELQRGLMVMCPPETHDVAKCPPWSNVPTRHRAEIDGKFLGYAGCMLEAVNLPHCYPDAVVTIHSSCPQTGQELVMKLRGNQLVEADPDTIVGHVGADPRSWSDNWFKACSNNNFFSSLKAVAAWEQANPELAGVMLTLDQLGRFARYTNRLDYERGADPDDAEQRTATRMFGGLGVSVPAEWR